MKYFSLCLILLSGAACDSKKESPKSTNPATTKTREKTEEPSESQNSTRSASSQKNDTAKAEHFAAQLAGMPDALTKRDLFADILLTLPPDDHDIAVQAIIDDLYSPNSANLLTEYLEFSEMLDPALQLPAYATLLQEKRLSPLQRAAMDQQLREQLNITHNSPITDWKPLVLNFLAAQPGLINEHK